MKKSSYILSFDLGGTNIGAAAFDLNGKRLSDIQSLPTMAHQKPVLTLMNLKRAGDQARRKARLEGPPAAVGMGSTGGVDSKSGKLLGTEPLPNLTNFPMRDFVKSEFGAPLYLENDANCFALGEALAGAGCGHKIVLGITLGTGFGCGIVIDGRIYRGENGHAGEVAYCLIDGGCFDERLSGLGVQHLYTKISGQPATSPKQIGDLAMSGDEAALETWNAYGEMVGKALSVILAVVDPSICVIGGAVARRFSLFHEALKSTLRHHLSPVAVSRLQLEPSRLDKAAGVTGAAQQALQKISEKGDVQYRGPSSSSEWLDLPLAQSE